MGMRTEKIGRPVMHPFVGGRKAIAAALLMCALAPAPASIPDCVLSRPMFTGRKLQPQEFVKNLFNAAQVSRRQDEKWVNPRIYSNSQGGLHAFCGLRVTASTGLRAHVRCRPRRPPADPDPKCNPYVTLHNPYTSAHNPYISLYNPSRILADS